MKAQKPQLPRDRADTWIGGFIQPSGYVSSLSVRAGTVLAGGTELQLLRPGAAKFATRALGDDTGNAVAVAVEPRKNPRLAFAGVRSLTFLEGNARRHLAFGDTHPEPIELAWGPGGGGGPPELYTLFDDGVLLRFKPDDPREPGSMELPPVQAIASGATGGFGLACFDEERGLFLAYLLLDAKEEHYSFRSVEIGTQVSDVRLAIAGRAMAVSVEGGDVWLARRSEDAFVKVEGLFGGGPVAFQGSGADAPLFGTARDGDLETLVRVEPDGTASRIAEVGVKGSQLPAMIRQLAWDDSRKTLWAAAGEAGLMCSTSPGAHPPLGATAAS